MEQERSICLIKNIFDINCYGCGITKAVIAVIQIDLLGAYLYNKMIVVVMPLLLYVWTREILQTIRRLRLDFRP